MESTTSSALSQCAGTMLLRLLTTSFLAVCANSNSLPFRRFGSADSNSNHDWVANAQEDCEIDQKQDADIDEHVCSPCVPTSYGYHYACDELCPYCSAPDKTRCSMLNSTYGYMMDGTSEATVGYWYNFRRTVLGTGLEAEVDIQTDTAGKLIACSATVDHVPCQSCGSCDEEGMDYSAVCTNVDGLSVLNVCTETATGGFEGVFTEKMDQSCLNSTKMHPMSLFTPSLQELI